VSAVGSSRRSRVRAGDHGLARCEPAVEAAIYSGVLEAVQYATKHAGAGASAHGHAATPRDPSTESAESGLLSLRDLIEALAGGRWIHSAPGRGAAGEAWFAARETSNSTLYAGRGT